jgi:large conductance mechanosensitive channel
MARCHYFSVNKPAQTNTYTMGFVSDFRAFAIQGNVIDLAVGVVIGAAFGNIVTALVDDIIMPLFSLILGGKNFDNYYSVLNASEVTIPANMPVEEAKKAGANVLAWGHMIGSVVDFIIIAVCIFMVVRAIARAYRRKAADADAAAPVISSTDTLLMEIRDSLRRPLS